MIDLFIIIIIFFKSKMTKVYKSQSFEGWHIAGIYLCLGPGPSTIEKPKSNRFDWWVVFFFLISTMIRHVFFFFLDMLIQLMVYI